MKLSEILKDQSMISVGTVDAKGAPKVRMFNHQFIVDGKICFATSNTGTAYSELVNHPYAAVMQFARGNYVRIGGKVVVTEGEEKEVLKAKLETENPKLIEMYTKEGFDAKIEVLYFEDPELSVVDFKTHQLVDVEIS